MLAHGVFAGFIYGLVHMALGGYVINPVQGFLYYPLPFAALGLAGLLKKYPLIGVGVGITGRFIVLSRQTSSSGHHLLLRRQ